ncbi:hypothetical protein OY671_010998, partial [Metschnikowia pulcherrima]
GRHRMRRDPPRLGIVRAEREGRPLRHALGCRPSRVPGLGAQRVRGHRHGGREAEAERHDARRRDGAPSTGGRARHVRGSRSSCAGRPRARGRGGPGAEPTVCRAGAQGSGRRQRHTTSEGGRGRAGPGRVSPTTNLAPATSAARLRRGPPGPGA